MCTQILAKDKLCYPIAVPMLGSQELRGWEEVKAPKCSMLESSVYLEHDVAGLEQLTPVLGSR